MCVLKYLFRSIEAKFTVLLRPFAFLYLLCNALAPHALVFYGSAVDLYVLFAVPLVVVGLSYVPGLCSVAGSPTFLSSSFMID